MAALRGPLSFSRTFLSAARSAVLRPSPSFPRQSAPIARRPSLPFASHRSLSGELGALQSLLPLHSAVASSRLTPHLSANARACCELSQGT